MEKSWKLIPTLMITNSITISLNYEGQMEWIIF